jgi:LuxR family maltose regulon positive regulatory protein
LLFYKGDVRTAELFISHGLDKAREKTQFEYAHRALFYVLRIAVLQGDYQKAEQALKGMKAHLDHQEYHNRFINYDISLCWYYCVLGMPEKAPDWLKENFSPYCHAAFTDNFGNQMKARFCYRTKNYAPLLSYIQEMKQRESFLFGRVEMLAMEACVRYKLKENEKAFAVLSEAYQTAAPKGLLMPFLELGKDMRTLTANALKIPNIGIPRPWLEDLNRKAAIYAKHQARIVMEYRDAHNLTDDIVISPRESEILADLALGLSRLEIATNRSLSINTVKMIINNIYKKFGTENLADLIRIAVERKII